MDGGVGLVVAAYTAHGWPYRAMRSGRRCTTREPGLTPRHVEQRLTILGSSVDLPASAPARQILVGATLSQHIGLLGGNLVVERFAPFRFTRRHPELVGLTPVVGRRSTTVSPSSLRTSSESVDSLGLRVSSSGAATRFPSAVDG